MDFLCTLWDVQGSHGIVVKCTTATFFSYEEWRNLNSHKNNV